MSRTHGRISTYNKGCRCDDCGKANTARARRLRRKVSNERVLTDGRWVHPRAPHGTLNGYNYWSCRCPPCTEVHRVNTQEYKRNVRERTRSDESG